MPITSTLVTERTLTELDFARLSKLAHLNAPQWVTDLLDGVDILDAREVSPDTVMMYSTVDCQDLHTGHRQQLTVCYPTDAEPAIGFVSVLSPVGCSLLGCARVTLPAGRCPAGRAVARVSCRSCFSRKPRATTPCSWQQRPQRCCLIDFSIHRTGVFCRCSRHDHVLLQGFTSLWL